MKAWRIRALATTASTNDDAVKAAEAGEAEGLVIHALKQTAGRGRHGRTWESPEGNLYCSVLLRPPGTRGDFGFYSFVAALAMGDTVREFLPDANVTLKWPNDVLVNGKKIGGILLESGENYLVIGMGLNVRHHPEDALYPSTSLYAEHICSETGGIPLPLAGGVRGGPESQNLDSASVATSGPPPAPPASGRGVHLALFEVDHILQELLDRLAHWHETMQTKGFAPVRAVWLERAHKGRMTVKLPDEALEGDFIDIDATGHLRLRLADGGGKIIATGDVFFGMR